MSIAYTGSKFISDIFKWEGLKNLICLWYSVDSNYRSFGDSVYVGLITNLLIVHILIMSACNNAKQFLY